MSIDTEKLIKTKEDIQRTYEGGSTSVRVRNDVYEQLTEVCRRKKISIIKYVTIAIIEKILRES